MKEIYYDKKQTVREKEKKNFLTTMVRPGQKQASGTRHQEDEQNKATSCLFSIKMIAKLELTQSNAQQNIEQLRNYTMGVTIDNESTTTEPPPYNERQSKPLGDGVDKIHLTGTKYSP